MKTLIIALSNACHWAAAILALLTVSAFAGPPPVRGQYHVIDLGRLGGFRSEARGINAHGDIAGLSTSDIGYQAVRWRWGETNYLIEALGKGEAYGIADEGTAVGLSDAGGGTIWPAYGAPIYLGLSKRVLAVSPSGRPAGWISATATNPSPPFNLKFPKHAAWFLGTSAFDLALRPEWDCVANGVSYTTVVGGVLTNVFGSSQPTHAWLFPDRDLHGFIGLANSFALAVNIHTQVVGYANNINTGPFNQPMLWSEATGMRLLNVPGGNPYGSALGLNDRGQAVGALGSSGVLWVNVGQPDETNVFLNDLPPSGHGWNLQAGYAVNNRGEIVGYGLNPGGYVDGFVLVPTNTANRKIVLRALEVNQVIQDWANDIPLVADKDTIVRAHLQLYGTNTQPIVVGTARLRAWNVTSGATDDWSPDDGLVTVGTNDCSSPVLRSNLYATLNFSVRPGWKSGTNFFRFTWADGTVVNREPPDAAGDPGSNGQVRASFTRVPPLGVRFVRVAFTNGAGTNLPSVAQLDEQKRRLLSIYPISSIANLPYGYQFWSTANGAPNNEGRLVNVVNSARLLSTDANGAATNRTWYGVVSSNAVLRGLANALGGNAAEGKISNDDFNYQRHLPAHEIGHTLGRPHSTHSSFGPCLGTGIAGHCGECAQGGTPNYPMVVTPLGLMPTLGPLVNDDLIIWGYDHYSSQVISPYFYYDVMSYCYGSGAGFPAGTFANWPWNSQYTYTNLFDVILRRFSGEATGAGAPAGGPMPGDYLLVRGEINLSSNTVTFLPFYPLENPSPPPASGDYTLRVLNSSMQSLLDIPFTPDTPPGEFDYEPDASFNISIPFLPDAVGVAVLYQGAVVKVLLASPNAPVVQLLTPGGGETFCDTNVVVNWSASDADGDELFFLIQFSCDGGASWLTIGIDETSAPVDLPPDALTATTNGLIRVIATDGFNTAVSQSAGVLTVSNHAPRVSILRPSPGSLFFGDQTIVLSAAADDTDDGMLDGTNILWSSSLDGALGNGAMMMAEAPGLREGAHLITVTAIDGGGMTNTASVQIYVLHQPPPSLSISLTLGSTTLIAWPASATNFVLESSLTLATSGWTVVTNTPVMTNNLQTVTLGVTNASRFFRLRMQ